MSGNGVALPWLVIRQDANGNRYCVSRYATRAEAQSMAERLSGGGTRGGSGANGGNGANGGSAVNGGAEDRRYLVERLRRGNGDQA